jgi:hypothetical protein
MADIEQGIASTELTVERLDQKISLLQRKMEVVAKSMSDEVKAELQAIAGGRRRRSRRGKRPRKSRRSRRH